MSVDNSKKSSSKDVTDEKSTSRDDSSKDATESSYKKDIRASK